MAIQASAEAVGVIWLSLSLWVCGRETAKASQKEEKILHPVPLAQ